MIKKSNKYNYLQGTQIMDQGSRIYDVAGYRLPSVTTVLGKTKNQQFLKDWKAKVGEAEADESKIYLVSEGLPCTNSSTLYTRHWLR